MMDPQAALINLCQALAFGEYDRAYEYADALVGWLEEGGFAPQPNSHALYTMVHALRNYAASKGGE